MVYHLNLLPVRFGSILPRALYDRGGSTLTQQLVKNFFLTNERTLVRKATEALMSVLIELHYSKDEILEAYLNEVFPWSRRTTSSAWFWLRQSILFQPALSRAKITPSGVIGKGMVKGPSSRSIRAVSLSARLSGVIW